MPIYKSNQQLPAQPVIVLLIGDPGTAKTSLANTCNNPLIIDFDMGFKRSYGRPDSLQPKSWGEVMEIVESADVDQYDTIVVDTAKSALDDFAMVYVQEKDYRLKTNKLKAFGEIGEQFKLFINILRRKGKDIFIIAHSKQVEDGDNKRNVADITGQSSALLLRISDQVGYLHMRNDKRVISFNPTDSTIGKNVANLPDITLPPKESPEWKLFADTHIIQKVKDSLSVMDDDQRKALEFIEEWRNSIDALVPGDDETVTAKELLETMTEISKITEEHLKKQVRAYFTAHLKNIGWGWVAADKAFKPKAVEKPAPAEQPKEADSNPAALVKDEQEDLFVDKK